MTEFAQESGLPLDDDGLITHADAVAGGNRELLRRLHRSGAIERVAPGVYAARRAHRTTSPQDAAAEYRRHVLAVARGMPNRVFTSFSAAALLRLPIVGRWPEDVFVLSGGKTGSRRPGVREVAHRREVPHTEVDGVRVTPPEYTLLQLARHASLPAALVATDHALRQRPWDERPRPLVTMDRLRAEHERLLPYHGSRRADAVLARATWAADGPLETLSRLVIEQLGFADPVLQSRFWLPGLRRYAWVDFYWPECGVAAEADGHGKYLDGGDASGAALRVIEEKRREDELRPQLHGLTRWGWQEVWTVGPLERKLEQVGIPRTRRARRLFVL